MLNSADDCDTFKNEDRIWKMRWRIFILENRREVNWNDEEEERRTDLENIGDHCLGFFRWTDQTHEDEAKADADVPDFDMSEKGDSTLQSDHSVESERAETMTEYGKVVNNQTDRHRVLHSSVMRQNVDIGTIGECRSPGGYLNVGEKTNVFFLRYRREKIFKIESIYLKFTQKIVVLFLIIDWKRDFRLCRHLRLRIRNHEQPFDNLTRHASIPVRVGFESRIESTRGLEIQNRIELTCWRTGIAKNRNRTFFRVLFEYRFISWEDDRKKRIEKKVWFRFFNMSVQVESIPSQEPRFESIRTGTGASLNLTRKHSSPPYQISEQKTTMQRSIVGPIDGHSWPDKSGQLLGMNEK